MKKFLVVLMGLLFTTGAFAQDAGSGVQFDYNLYGLAFGTIGSYGSDEKWDYQHIRLRPMFTAGNENIKGVVRLQIDQKYGSLTEPSVNLNYNGSSSPYDAYWGTQADPAGAGPSARNRAVKIYVAYLELSNLFVNGLSLTTGIKDYFYPIITDTELALTAATYDFGMGSVSLYYFKLDENSLYSRHWNVDDPNAPYWDPAKNQDAQAYGIDATIKAGLVDIRPAFFFVNTGKGWGPKDYVYDYSIASPYKTNEITTTDLKVYIGAINASGDMGIFNFDATVAYLKAKSKWVNEEIPPSTNVTSGKYNQSAYAVDLNANVKPDKNIVAGVFGTYASGTKDGKENKKLPFSATVHSLFGYAPAGKLFFLQSGGSHALGGLEPENLGIDYDRLYKYGNMTFGLNAQYTIQKFTIMAQYGYMMAANKNKQGDKNIGSEIDGKISFEAAPKTDLFLEYAYVIKGDDTLLKKNIQQILWGLSTSI